MLMWGAGTMHYPLFFLEKNELLCVFLEKIEAMWVILLLYFATEKRNKKNTC